MTPETIAAHLRVDADRWPDSHGVYHADCPFCTKPAKRGQTHFTLTADGLCYCQVCGQGTTIRALAEQLHLTLPKSAASPRVEYTYHDAAGAVAFQVVRYYKDNKKLFFQRHPDGRGGWINGMAGVDRVLYHLPDVTEAIKAGKPIYVVEGEKDADALRARGLVATTNPQGAGKWNDRYSAALTGATVYVIPDNDEPGRAHARTVAQCTRGVARSVRVVDLPDVPEKGDVSDWLGAGHTIDELAALCAPPVAPAKSEYTSTPTLPIDSNDLLAMERQPVKWFAPSFLREGLGLMVGLPQVGKTPLALQLGIAIATGGKWMGRVQCRRARVLYLGVEYTRQELIPLLDISRCGAAIERGMLIFKTMEDEFPRETEAALSELEWYIRVLEVEVIIIDVLTAFLPPEKFKQSIYRGDYTELKPYHRLASLHHAAILGTWHGSKREVDPRLMYNGSVGMWAVPASRMALYMDQEQRVRLSSFPRMCDRLDWALTQERTDGGRRWVVSDAAPEPMMSDTERTIWRWLKENSSKSNPRMPSTVSDMTGIVPNTVKGTLRRMFEKNLIQQSAGSSGYFIEQSVTDVTLVTGVTDVSDVTRSVTNGLAHSDAPKMPRLQELQGFADTSSVTSSNGVPADYQPSPDAQAMIERLKARNQ